MTSDDYFFESANNISFFFEEGAHDKEGKLQQEKALSINKIGHALHDVDPVFRKWTRSHKLTQLLLDLGLIKPMPVQSMYIFKVTAAFSSCSSLLLVAGAMPTIPVGIQYWGGSLSHLSTSFPFHLHGAVFRQQGQARVSACLSSGPTAVCHAATPDRRQVCASSGKPIVSFDVVLRAAKQSDAA